MRSLLFTTTTAIGFLSNFAIAVPDPQSTADPSTEINWLSEPAFIGCFSKSDVGNLFTQEDTGQTSPTRGICRNKCTSVKSTYTAISDDYCWCGNQLPSAQSADYLNCDTPCTNYPLDSCGSKDYFYIYGTDMALRDPRKWDWSVHPLHNGTATSTSSTPSQTVIKDSTTVLVTAPGSQSTTANAPAPKSNNGVGKAGAAAGAVVGVVLAITVGVATFLYIRKQKRRRVEEEYRRSVAVREYAKKPESDMRLDPMILHRRASDGSIADNQDYSRRILKVTNPDG